MRSTTESDIDRIIGFEQDPDNAPYIRHWTADEHKAGIANANVGHFVIRDTERGTDVGQIVLIGMEDRDRSVEFKRITAIDKGRGYGRAAVGLVKQVVFAGFCFHRLWLEVPQDNTRAHSLYASEGFIEKGIHREALRQGEQYRSLVVMSMLDQEYRAHRQTANDLKAE